MAESSIILAKDTPESDLDDYMSMKIAEPAQPPQKETYTQRRIRKEREVNLLFPLRRFVIHLTLLQAESKSRPPASSAVLETALSTSLPPISKGFRMLSKLGYTPGSKLGAVGNENGMLEPMVVEMKEGKEGLGMANEKKRKFREEVEGKEILEKGEQEGYRERVGREREARRTEGQLGGAMRVLEGLEAEEELNGDESQGKDEDRKGKKMRVNVLYRGLVREREEKERERRARYDLLQSLSKNAAYNGDTEDEKQDRLAWGAEEEESEEDIDEDLVAFEALEPSERLERLVRELRERYSYCFWCKYRYESKEMEGCPGIQEDDHD